MEGKDVPWQNGLDRLTGTEVAKRLQRRTKKKKQLDHNNVYAK